MYVLITNFQTKDLSASLCSPKLGSKIQWQRQIFHYPQFCRFCWRRFCSSKLEEVHHCHCSSKGNDKAMNASLFLIILRKKH